MKRCFFILGLLLIATAALAQSELYDLLPPYWIVGRVLGTTEADVGATAVSADGRYVDFYKSAEDLALGHYAQGRVSGNQFILNAFHIWPGELAVGQTYNVATERRGDNYGANGTITISGLGWDAVADMAITANGGIARPLLPPGGGGLLTQEAMPGIKIWFGSRLYQPVILEAGQPFVVADTPQIRADISIAEPYSISSHLGDYAIEVDPGTSGSRNLSLGVSNMTSQAYAAASALKSFSLQYEIAETDKLSDGEHVFQVTARSSGAQGVVSTAVALATVEVMGGPLRIIGTPLTFPAPFRRTADTNVTIQYTLSANADIDLYLYSVEGRIVRKFICPKGTEGGTAGTNKVIWDTLTQAGDRAGASIYVGSIVAKEENRLLAKFKIAIIE